MGQCMNSWLLRMAFWRRASPEAPWLSDRVFAACPVLKGILREIRSLEKERRTPANTHSASAIRAKWLLPSWWLYALSVLLSGSLVGGLLLVDRSAASAALDSSTPMQIAVVILSLAVPVVSTYTGIRARDELSIAYLWDVTRFARFAECAGAAVVANLSSWLSGAIAAVGSHTALVVHTLMGIVGLGLTVGTVLALIAIMLEVILVASRPGFAAAAGARHHALALAEGLHRHRYIALFLQTHESLLDRAAEQMPGIEGPGGLLKLYCRGLQRPQTTPWQIDEQMNFDTHSLDYNLDRLQDLAATLPEGTTLYLEGHGAHMNRPGKRLSLGQIVPANPALAQRLGRATAVVRARRDDCLEWRHGAIEAWRDLLRRRIDGVLSEYDQTSYTALVSTVREAWFRSRSVVPKTVEESPVVWRLGEFYLDILDQILRSQPRIGVTWARQVHDFVAPLQREFRTGVDECVKEAELDLLDIHLGQIPRLYDMLCQCSDSHEGEPEVATVHHIRAFWGRDLKLFDGMVAELPDDLSAEQKGVFLHTIHRRCTQWLHRALERKDGDCAASIAGVLVSTLGTAQGWRDTLAGARRGRTSLYDVILLRHFALLGETIQRLSQPAPAGPQVAEELLKAQVPLDTQSGLDVLAIAGASSTDTLLDDFGHRWDLPLTSTDPLLGSGVGATAWGSPERVKLFLGLTFCLMKACRAVPQGELPAVRPQAVDVGQVEASLKALKSAGDALAQHEFLLWRQDEKRLLEWLRRCQCAYDVAKAIELAKAPPNDGLVAEYAEVFPREYALGLRLFRHLHRNGLFSVSDAAEIRRMDYVAKEKFLTLEEKGYSEPDVFKRDARGFAYRSEEHFIFLLLEALKGTVVGPGVTEKPGRRTSAAIQNAARWLARKSVDPIAGLILWNGPGMLDGVLQGDSAWVPSWQEPLESEGFAGKYAGYPVWECHGHASPVVAAVDLGASKPLLVRPSVRESDRWCEVVEVTARLGKPLKRRIKEEHRRSQRHVMVGHYCRRRLRFFWEVDVRALRDHARLFPPDPDEEEATEP